MLCLEFGVVYKSLVRRRSMWRRRFMMQMSHCGKVRDDCKVSEKDKDDSPS